MDILLIDASKLLLNSESIFERTFFMNLSNKFSTFQTEFPEPAILRNYNWSIFHLAWVRKKRLISLLNRYQYYPNDVYCYRHRNKFPKEDFILHFSYWVSFLADKLIDEKKAKRVTIVSDNLKLLSNIIPSNNSSISISTPKILNMDDLP